MQKQLKLLSKYFILFTVGAFAYVGIELVFRGHSHWTMGILGGISFISIGLINEILTWETPLWIQCSIGGLLITFYEFITGLILNVCLHMDMGQICLPFTIAWCGLSLIGIILDDYLRYWWFKEEKPRYKLF